MKNPPQVFDRSPVKVVVVSRDPLARAGMEGLLAGREDVEVVDDGAEVILWDGGTGLVGDEARLREIGELGAPVLAVVAGEADARAALDAGARGALLRDRLGPGLAAALQATRHGLTVLDAGLAPRPRRESLPADAGFEELTPREQEVLQHMAEGRSNKEIAAALGISDHTAKFHVNAVLTKLDAATRTEAVVTAVRRGLVLL